MEDFLPSLLLHPDDKYFLQCLRQERYARSLFSSSEVPYAHWRSPFDRTYCHDFASFRSKFSWFDATDVMKLFMELLYPEERELWTQFMDDSTDSVFVYHFKGESCRKFRSLRSWLFQEVISCVAFHARCFCVVFKSLDTVMEVHFTCTETFDSTVTHQVRILDRFVSASQQAYRKLNFRCESSNMEYKQCLTTLCNSVIQNGATLGQLPTGRSG